MSCLRMISMERMASPLAEWRFMHYPLEYPNQKASI